jgi:glycyl-tRNA synthetase alpha subunit
MYLESTAARIEVEKTAARALYDKLCLHYGGKGLQSEFQEAKWDFDKTSEKVMKQRFSEYINRRKKDISSHVLTLNFDDLSACMSNL